MNPNNPSKQQPLPPTPMDSAAAAAAGGGSIAATATTTTTNTNDANGEVYAPSAIVDKLNGLSVSTSPQHYHHHQHLHSVIERHEFSIGTKIRKTPIQGAFFSYYNNRSPIYYEIAPIVRILNFIKEFETIASIPSHYVRVASSFNDQIFANHHIAPNTVFAEAAAISYLIAISESKTLGQTVRYLYDTTIRNIENGRTQRLDTQLTKLKHRIADLKDKHDHHSTIVDAIKDTMEMIVTHSGEIHKILNLLHLKF